MRKTTTMLGLAALLIGTSAAGQGFSASAMKAERDRMEAGEGVRFMDAVPTWGHAGRIQAAEDEYHRQVQEAQGARLQGQMMQMERALSEARTLERESLEARRDYYRSRIEDDRPRRSLPPPPPPRPPRP